MAGRVLVRRPGPRLAAGLVLQPPSQPVDVSLALRQWDAYVATWLTNGWTTTVVPAADECPDAVFVEDTMVVYRDVAVVSRPGAESRRAEVGDAEKTVEALGLTVEHISAPGTLDGGDVLKIGDTIYVGQGGRTNAAGIAQLRSLFGPLGATVVGVPVTRVLHLKSAVTALPDGTVIGFLPNVDNASVFPRFLPVPEESGAHVVVLGQDSVLMAADCPQSTALITSLGYNTVTTDISEFQKLDGCVTCLSVRLRADRPQVPA